MHDDTTSRGEGAAASRDLAGTPLPLGAFACVVGILVACVARLARRAS